MRKIIYISIIMLALSACNNIFLLENQTFVRNEDIIVELFVDRSELRSIQRKFKRNNIEIEYQHVSYDKFVIFFNKKTIESTHNNKGRRAILPAKYNNRLKW